MPASPRRAVRVSLTLWYVGAMLIVLGVYASGVFLFVSRNLSHSLDERAEGRLRVGGRDGRAAAGRIAHLVPGTARGGGDEEPWLQVWTPDGERLYQTRVGEPSGGGRRRAARRESNGRHRRRPDAERHYRVLSGRATVANRPVVLQVARTESAMREELWMLGVILVVGLPFGDRRRRRRRLHAGQARARAGGAHGGARADRSRRRASAIGCRSTTPATSWASLPRCSTTRSPVSSRRSARCSDLPATCRTSCARRSPRFAASAKSGCAAATTRKATAASSAACSRKPTA